MWLNNGNKNWKILPSFLQKNWSLTDTIKLYNKMKQGFKITADASVPEPSEWTFNPFRWKLTHRLYMTSDEYLRMSEVENNNIENERKHQLYQYVRSTAYIYEHTNLAIFTYVDFYLDVDYNFDGDYLGDILVRDGPKELLKYTSFKWYAKKISEWVIEFTTPVFLTLVGNACAKFPKLMLNLTEIKSDENFETIFKDNHRVLQYASPDFQTIERLKIIVTDDFRFWDTHNEGARQGWVQKLVRNTHKFSLKDIETLTDISNSGVSVYRNYNNSVGLLKVKPLVF